MTSLRRSSEKIAVIGCGFAGLVSGITGIRHGFNLEIFESNSSPLNVGGTVTIFPNGMAILDSLGVAKEVLKAGAKTNIARFLDNKGSLIVDRELGSVSHYGHATVTIRRALLDDILRGYFLKLGGVISYNKKLTEIDFGTHFSSSKVKFSDGTTIDASLIVGSDGINSRVRQLISETSSSPDFKNIVYFGGFVSNQELIHSLNLQNDIQYVAIGPKSFLGYSIVDGEVTENKNALWYTYLESSERISREKIEELKARIDIDDILNFHKDWSHTVKDLISNTSELVVANVSEIIPVSKWFKENAVIIGDAAHGMNPLSGQGACTAIEDAYVLFSLLASDTGSLSKKLETFQNHRSGRVYRIQKKARSSSKLTRIELPGIITKIRNYAFGLVTKMTPRKVLNRNFYYNADQVVQELQKLL